MMVTSLLSMSCFAHQLSLLITNVPSHLSISPANLPPPTVAALLTTTGNTVVPTSCCRVTELPGCGLCPRRIISQNQPKNRGFDEKKERKKKEHIKNMRNRPNVIWQILLYARQRETQNLYLLYITHNSYCDEENWNKSTSAGNRNFAPLHERPSLLSVQP